LKNDVAAQESLYLDLQTKVPYHSQVDNDPTYKNKTKEETVKTEKERQDEAYVMCNVTSLAMAFEMLGVSKEDAITKLKEDDILKEDGLDANIADKEFEDIIDFIRVKKALTVDQLNRSHSESWKLVANYLGISTESQDVNSSDINSDKWKIHRPIIEKALKEGDGVVLSLFRTKGHIVRLQSISNDNIVVDDPFGELKSMAKRELPLTDPSGNYTRNEDVMTKDGGQRGKDVKLTWEEINVGVNNGGHGGAESMDGNVKLGEREDKLLKKNVDYTVLDWANDISPCEYKIEEIEKINEKGKKYKSKIVKCYGGMVKFYLIFKKQ